jgi:hypothetical protein
MRFLPLPFLPYTCSHIWLWAMEGKTHCRWRPMRSFGQPLCSQVAREWSSRQSSIFFPYTSAMSRSLCCVARADSSPTLPCFGFDSSFVSDSVSVSLPSRVFNEKAAYSLLLRVFQHQSFAEFCGLEKTERLKFVFINERLL